MAHPAIYGDDIFFLNYGQFELLYKPKLIDFHSNPSVSMGDQRPYGKKYH